MKLRTLVPCVLLLAACAQTPPLASSQYVQVVDSTVLPPPTSGLESESAYQIGPLDKLVIDVFGFPDLIGREVQVDAAGRISVPMAGSVEVGGLSPAQAEVKITERLRAAFVRNPQVSVNIQESLSRFITVDGEVGQPGNYPVVSDMTLMRAVAAARGASEFAELEDVVVFRTVNGQQMAALYNLAAIRRGMYADPRVYAKDVIVVGNSPSRRLFRDIIMTAPLLSAPIVALLR